MIPGMTRGRRGPTALVVACAAALFGVVSAPQPTSAAWTDTADTRASATTQAFTTWRPWYGQLRLYNTTRCLDVANRSVDPGTIVRLYDCNSTPAQIWAFPVGSDTLRVYASVGVTNPNDGSTRCLQWDRPTRRDPYDLTIQDCGDLSGTFEWGLSAVTGGYQLRSSDGTALCLQAASTANEADVTAVTCSANQTRQRWVPEPVLTVVY